MAKPKNIFNFGTGDIDKDQWLRDIDSELEDFISKYGMATNKHRTALLRQAFQDLRTRIANGDMLNRTADGRYQFGSMLNRDDKHMQEAYERALGFMGGLARRQIQAPPVEPEKKKYNTKTLNDRFIRFFNPSGNLEAFTSLWNSYDDNTRKVKLLEFLRNELNTGLNNYQDVEDYDSMDNLKTRINNFISDPNITNLNSLGFNKNYLNQLTTTTEEEEKPKSELEQVQADIAAAQEAQQILQGKQYLDWYKYKGNPLKWEFETRPYDYQGMFNYNRKNGNIKTSYLFLTPNFGSFSFTPFLDKLVLDTKQLRLAFDKQNTELITNYLKDLGVNYSTMAGQARLGAILGMLQSNFTVNNKTATPYASQMSKYFTPMLNGAYYINGSANKKTGRYAFYTPKLIGTYTPGIHEVSILDLDDPAAKQALGVVQSNKQGGVIKKLDGGGEISDQDWANYLNKVEPKIANPVILAKTVSKLKSRNPSDGWTAGDYALLGSAAADIASAAASYVPGGQAVSGILGAGSTLTSSIVDFKRNNIKSGLVNLVLGLGADVAGMLPVVGTAAKTAKIAKTIGKLSKILVPAFTAMGATQALSATGKVIKGEALTPLEWQDLAQGIQLIISGGAKGIAGHSNSAFKRTQAEGVTHYDVKLEDGTTSRITREEFEGAKRNDYKGTAKQNIFGQVKGVPVVTKEGVEKANKLIVSESLNPFNSATRRLKLYMLNKAGDQGYYIKNWIWPEWSPIQNKLKKILERRLESTLSVAPKGNLTNLGTNPPPIGHKLGGVLKALRNGGILKADTGLLFPDLKPELNFNSQYYQSWVNLNWNNPENFQATLKGYKPGGSSYRISNGLPAKGGEPKKRYENSQGEQDFMSAYQEQQAYYDKDAGSHIFGDVLNYYNLHWLPSNQGRTYEDFIKDYNSNVDKLRLDASKKLTGVANLDKTWGEYNTLFNLMYANYSPFSEKLKDTLGESTWRRTPNTFNGINDRENLRYGLLNPKDPKSKVILNNEGHLVIPDVLLDSEGNDPTGGTQTKKGGIDSATERKTLPVPEYKNPFDPSLLISTAKYFAGLRGNRDIYQNLLDEMPEAPLRDPLDRKLAIVGWLERIKNGQNQLADLRRVLLVQQGSDQLTNFATALETERTGRDIMDKAFAEDSGRQFETALKSWNLDNEDILYNTGVGDANRKSIADRQRMMAQIRAAWRSGDQNLKMGLLADAGNWFMKRYQREQDMVDKAKELSLGTPEEWAQSEYTSRLGELANKKASDLTPADRAKIDAVKAQVMREMRLNYSLRYYNLYHTPGFGGGLRYTLLSKYGSKLEVAKLKARSKDNDRYVSMIKGLRKRRRR